MSLIKFNNVYKNYQKNKTVLDNISLEIKQGEFIVLIGASGCGKTTLLKLINGIISPTKGDMYYKNEPYKEIDPIKLKRNIGYVIQQIGLFPHMTIEENIGYVLNIMKKPIELQKSQAKELIHIVGLDETYLNKYPRELSGGQKQRVGVARALAADQDIILMDEPFGAVDDITRRVLQDEIIRLYKDLGKTIVFVTHDIEEALKLGTKIILLKDGKIEQSGTKEDMIFKPATAYVETFFGSKNFSAYLNITEIKEVMERRTYLEEVSESISQDETLTAGLKRLFNSGKNEIAVRNNRNEIVGCFSIGNACEGIHK